MSKSRKDLFEEQLRDLQKDINNLSQKLATPSAETSTIRADRSAEKQTLNDSIISVASTNHVEDSRHSKITGSSTKVPDDKNHLIDRLRQELHNANKERDDAVYRLEQSKLEVDQLKRTVQEFSRLKASYDHLKQDHDCLRISLESSERIRTQQKELINLLQRSHALGNTASDVSVVSASSNASSIPLHHGPVGSGLGGEFHHPTHMSASSAAVAQTRDRLLSFSSNMDSTIDSAQQHTAQHPSQQQPLSSSRVRRKTKVPSPYDPRSGGSSLRPNNNTSRPSLTKQLIEHRPTSTKPVQAADKKRPKSKSNKPLSKQPTVEQQQQNDRIHQAAVAQFSPDMTYQEILQRNKSLVPDAHTASYNASHRANSSHSALLHGSMTSDHNLSAFENSSFMFETASARSVRSGSFDSSVLPAAPTHQQTATPSNRHDVSGRPPRPPLSGVSYTPTSSSGMYASQQQQRPQQQPHQLYHHQIPTAASTPPLMHHHGQLQSKHLTVGSPSSHRHHTPKVQSERARNDPVPYCLPSYGGSYEQDYPLSTTSSDRNRNTEYTRVVKVKKTRSHSAPPVRNQQVGLSPTRNQRIIQVPIPSPATTFGSAQRNL